MCVRACVCVVCLLCGLFVGVVSFVCWCFSFRLLTLPLITLLQLTSESNDLYSVSAVKCWWW